MTNAARWVLGCLALAAVYFAGAWLAHWLALPPTMVMPIWPPSGIALVGLALFGRRLWPGIVLGSLLFHALIQADPVDAGAWLAAALISVGGVLQALLALALLNRFGGSVEAPVSKRLLLRQMALAGPLAGLLNPLWGTAVWVVLGKLPLALAGEAVLAWWLGGSIGVIALLPLLYVWRRRDEQLRRRRLLLSVSMLSVAVLVVLTALNLRGREQAEWQAEQDLLHSRIWQRFSQQQDDAEQALLMLRALYASSEQVTRAEFQVFVQEQLPFAPAVTALQWVPRVSAEERAAFEQRQRQQQQQLQQQPVFEIRQLLAGVSVTALPRAEYFPITYLEPHTNHRNALGLDLLTEPVCAEFIRRIQHSRRLQISEPLPGADAAAAKLQVLAGLPHPTEPIIGGAPLGGVLIAVIDIDVLLQSALTVADQTGVQARLWLEDGDAQTQLLSQWPVQPEGQWQAGRQNSFSRQFGDRRWQLDVITSADRLPVPLLMWLTLILGLLFSAVLGLHLLSASHYTARIEAEVAARTRELAAARDQAVAASQAKSQFLAGMSHEIRTPLTAIMGYTELMLDDTATPVAVKAPLQIVLDSSRTLLTLINDVLDLAKIEAGHMTLEQKPCSILAVVQEVIRLLQPRAEQKQLLLLADYRFPLPATVRCDPLRLRQILLNLLGNAIKFTDVGQIQLQLRAELSETVARFTITVSDTGIGIAPAHQQRVFEPFEQAPGEADQGAGGTGLGLAISRQLARLLGGDIQLHSAPGQGSTFVLHFPAERLDADLLVSEFEQGPLLAAADSRIRFSGQVLLAEDNAVNAKLATQLLQGCGVQVDVAGDGLVALSMLEQARQRGRPYDLLFLDMQMPRMDGYETVRKLRAASYHLPVIALTANAMSGDRERCLAAGCDAFVSKPFQRHEIEVLLRQFLHLKPFD